MTSRGDDPARFGPEDARVLDEALKLLADIPGTNDQRIADALGSPFLGVKCREVVASAGRVHPGVLQGGEQAAVAVAFARAVLLAGWPQVLEFAVQLTPVLAQIAADQAGGPLRHSPGSSGTAGEDWLFMDEITLGFLYGIPPGEDWHASDNGAGPHIQVADLLFPVIPSGEVP